MLDAVLVISSELKLPPEKVAGAVELLREGATVPFLARYRKERVGSLNEEQLYDIKERLGALVSLEARRSIVLSSVKAQDKLTDELKAKIDVAATRTALEDLYVPYCPKRKSPGATARTQGLEPLAEQILKQEGTGSAEDLAAPFLSAEKGVKETTAALKGARAIVAERLAEDPTVRAAVRELIAAEGKLTTQAAANVALERTKYSSYANFTEPLSKLPSHRILAVLRGESEKKLKVALEVPREKIVELLRAKVTVKPESAFAAELTMALDECLNAFLLPAMEEETRSELKTRADLAAAELFSRNLKALLHQPPYGAKRVMAGAFEKRSGLHIVALDEAGKVLAHASLALNDDEKRKAAREKLQELIREHKPVAVCSGNDVEGRDADAFFRDTLTECKIEGVERLLVNEAGAAAYSASRAARDEFPDAQPALRAAISIGRRLQNPIAELVKIHPKSIGVGQYQHDVDQRVLLRKLEEAVESCVNAVGVNINTADVDLLTHVSGLGQRLAASIVETRARHNTFKRREDLRQVPGFGPKAYELAAPFLRIIDGENPLDNTCIHPERYNIVQEMAENLGVKPKDLLGNAELLSKLDQQRYRSAEVGEETVSDIVTELKEPGKDPRGQFVRPQFNEGVQDIADLKDGQVLNGVVTNLTAFGAFVDIGVHQDGLVHVSELSYKFVKDPALLLSVGQAVKVKVLSVESDRKRISLSIKALEEAPAPRPKRTPRPTRPPRRGPDKPVEGAAGTPGEPAAVASGAEGTPPAGGPPRRDGARRFERRPRRDGPGGAGPAGAGPGGAAPGGERSGGQRREGSRDQRGGRGDRGSRERKPEVAPGKPDYSKFFVRSKRKERRDTGPRRENEATRDDIRQIIKTQGSGGQSLGNLLKKAGLKESEEEKRKE
jgi:uncharacterized protein